MKSFVRIGLIALALVMGLGAPVQAETTESAPVTSEAYLRAKVLSITAEGTRDVGGTELPYQVVEVELIGQSDPGALVTIEHGTRFSLRADQLVEVGEQVIVRQAVTAEGAEYEILDHWRLPGIAWFGAGVALLVMLIGGKRGALALGSLAITYWLLVAWVAPQILGGAQPLLVSLAAATVIATITMYVTHGFRRETGVALGAILVSVVVATLLASRAVDLAHLFGFGSEEAYGFQFGPYANLDFRGILLAGMILGTLGVLDDVATAQTATVEELAKANRQLGFGELYRRGLVVGRVHIASLVNTLVLAYAGASFPLFLALVVGQAQPFWVTINSEFFGEEIVRSLVGSAALILSVPIATAVSAWYFAKKSVNAN